MDQFKPEGGPFTPGTMAGYGGRIQWAYTFLIIDEANGWVCPACGPTIEQNARIGDRIFRNLEDFRLLVESKNGLEFGPTLQKYKAFWFPCAYRSNDPKLEFCRCGNSRITHDTGPHGQAVSAYLRRTAIAEGWGEGCGSNAPWDLAPEGSVEALPK